ncbi:flagellar type III secretion system pore protein FliP [Clostridium weizhouense]|uniref:Flagellar biosynthetic protein FliP n=1 Tax=Clostridium weizhouense TaxID=2859781 RepID=A0ABS7AIP9_9CLOT|nr:flagellar type III secretion system pore protein FliP [Clostridium weizhouense]MBW6408548.1 flagellar type III secretion system pore protein FliP [Clostridium weizhouense]
MGKNKKRVIFMLVLTFAIIAFSGIKAQASPTGVDLPQINLSVGNGETTPNDYVNNIKILIFFTILAVLPSIVIMITSFTRIVVVFSFVKSAMGVQQAIPNQVLVGLALFLTVFIMTPVYNDVNTNAVKPYLDQTITQDEAIEIGSKPIKDFMLRQTREKDLELFVELSGANKEELTRENIPFTSLIPAFAISELKTAFQIGFLIYLPFIVIDMVVGSLLMSMGMMMLPPVMISLPFKLLLFVMVDGWYLLVKSLVMSFS